jgi:hypothetical protein
VVRVKLLIAACLGANVRCVARVNIDTSHKSQRMCCHTVETVRPYIHTQQSGNCNDYIEMYEIFNPEIPGLETVASCSLLNIWPGLWGAF